MPAIVKSTPKKAKLAKKPSKPKDRKKPRKETALAVAEPARDPSLPAVAEQDKPLFAEALRRGESTREGMEQILKEYGTWLFVNVFASDSNKAIHERKDNVVWQNLLARSGGSTLRINEQMLTVCLVSAAYDKRLNSDSWRLLDLGRKELLLRLGDDDLLREGAAHVVDGRLTWRMTREYVQNTLRQLGEKPQVRVTVPQVKSWLTGIQARLNADGFQRKLEKLAEELESKERTALQRQVSTLHKQLGELAERLGGRKRLSEK